MNESQKKINDKYIYVLRLEEGKFYIGQSASEKRIEKHFKGKGAEWTKLYRPIEVVERIELKNVDFKAAEVVEVNTTLKYMKEYGWKNVRGGYYIYVADEANKKALLAHKKKNKVIIDFELDD